MTTMKKIIIALISIVSILSFQSCEKFLDLEPVSQGILVENTSADSLLYKTGAEVEAALAGVYAISGMNISNSIIS